MQFSLRSLFLIVTGLALFCGVVFSLPVMATGLILALTLLLSPAVWVSGASFASEGKQAFFRGGLICGILPFVASGYGLVLYTGGVVSPIYSLSMVQSTYPVAATYQGPIYPNPPSSYDPYGPTNPGEAPTMPDSLPPPDGVTPTIGEDPVLPPDTSPQPASEGPAAAPDASPQAVYASTTISVPSLGGSVTYGPGPVLPAAQMPSPATSTYAETLGMRLTLAAIWLAPGFFSFCGGTISYVTYRLVRPASSPADSRSGMIDYQVVQGRLTTVSPVAASSGSE